MENLLNWFEKRLPVMNAYKKHLSEYPMPKNFNFWYLFGSLAMLVLVNQLLTGIWLTMSYNPSAEGAFASVEFIMRDVEYGWLLRYMHSTGASAFFVVGLSAHVPRVDLRLIPKTTRTSVDFRHADLLGADG